MQPLRQQADDRKVSPCPKMERRGSRPPRRLCRAFQQLTLTSGVTVGGRARPGPCLARTDQKMIELQAPDWWHEIPTLTGPTIEVREVQVGDTGSLFEMLTDPKVARYISNPPPSAAAFQGFVEWAHRRREAGACVCL